MDRGDTMQRRRGSIAALRSLLGEDVAWPLMCDAVAVAEQHRSADELSLAAELFRCWSLVVGEREAQAARWASLRSEPHWLHNVQTGHKGE